MKPQKVLLFFLFALLSTAPAVASEGSKRVVELVAEKRLSEAEKLTQKELAKKDLPEREKAQLQYFHVLIPLMAGEPEKSLERVNEVLKSSNLLLEEDLRGLRSQALEKMKKLEDMIEEDKRILAMDPNFLLRSEAQLRTGRAYREQGKITEARKIFTALERRARGTPEHPDVMIELARTERMQKNTAASCRWLRDLYRRHPIHPQLKDWGPDLASNEFDGKPTGCTNTRGQFRDRLRALLWAAEEDKARREVHEVAALVATSDRIAGDELRAWFLLQSGYPDEAFQLLEPSAPQKKNDSEFLSVFASAAARSGNNSAAVAAFHRMWELAPNLERGRKSLYQSAFLSYQFRDYDGASRRFSEFIKKYPRSGLARDARWNLAWITYLKGDFNQARSRFEEILKMRNASSLREKARYWIAMTHYRQDRPDLAKEILESVADGGSGSYYSTLARERLKRLPAIEAPQTELASANAFRSWGPLQSTPILLSAVDGWNVSVTPPAGLPEESESEESLAAETERPADIADAESDEESTSDLVQETGRSEVVEEARPVKSPANSRRFERARALIALQRIDEARWELYEIERKTSNRDELRILIGLYEEAGQWHRSSAIAHLRFASERVKQGMMGARGLWVSAYPQAYGEAVRSSAKRYNLPEEFVWGIMRAESRYRKDAVSPVGALGLMQIMPGTGRRLADLMGDRKFNTPNLLEPEVAVRMGSYYLRRLSNQFGDSLPLTAAAYNAGPHRVHSWLVSFGGLDYDEFVEHIPFLETREYVRRVMANALTYAELYQTETKLADLVAPVKAKGRPEFAKKENWDPL